jgi:hypothetical protein
VLRETESARKNYLTDILCVCGVFPAISEPSDELSGTLRRVQTWLPLHLPRCGSCEVYGAVDGVRASDSTNSSSTCADVSDITTLQGPNVRLAARDDFAISAPLPASGGSDNESSRYSSSQAHTSPVNKSSGKYGVVQDAENPDDASFMTTSAFLPIAGATLFIVVALLARLFLKRGAGSCCTKESRSMVGEKPSRQTGNAAYARVVVNDESDDENEISDNDVEADADTRPTPAGALKSDGARLLRGGATSDREPGASDRGREGERGLSPRQARSPSPSQRSSSSAKRSDQIV